CAIYTRVSTEAGLEQDFNSLDAQYDAAQAYIRGQAHAGWTLIRTRYDDGGYSRGSTQRPAPQRLPAPAKDRHVPIHLASQVDRLTRSLADFAKLVELFDAHGVSFVSVTQQFQHDDVDGPTHSQRAAVVCAVRAGGHRRAHSRQGGGLQAQGPVGRRNGAAGIRTQGWQALHRRRGGRAGPHDLYSVSRARQRQPAGARASRAQCANKGPQAVDGGTRGGVLFTQGPLFYLLRNRFYIGEVLYKGEICPGPQPPLLERELFAAVQRRLTEQRSHHVTTRTKNDAPLKGILFDAAGDPMVATHATKQGLRYRYYVSQPYLRRLATPPIGAIVRVPAPDIEAVVSKALSEYLARSNTAAAQASSADQPNIRAMVDRIEVRTNAPQRGRRGREHGSTRP